MASSALLANGSTLELVAIGQGQSVSFTQSLMIIDEFQYWPRAIKSGSIEDIRWVLSQSAENGTHPCVALCKEFRNTEICHSIRSADDILVEDATCCARKDRETSPTSVRPMLGTLYKELTFGAARRDDSALMFEFLLVSADGMAIEVLRAFELDTLIIEHIIFSGTPSEDSVRYVTGLAITI